MDATERIDLTLAQLQSICERMLGINPDNRDALELLWEVQRERAANLYCVPTHRTQPQHEGVDYV